MSKCKSSTTVRFGATLVALALLLAAFFGVAHSHGLDTIAKPCAVCVLAGAPGTAAAPVAVDFQSIEVGSITESPSLPASSRPPTARSSRAPPAS